MKRILVINPGSTSTKAAIYEDMACVASESIKMDQEVLEATDRIVEQLKLRTEQIAGFIGQNGLKVTDFDIIAARGGMLPACRGGAYRVNKLMVDVLRFTSKGQHASNLSCMIGLRLTEGLDLPVIVYDPLTVDEMDETAKMTGLPEIRLEPIVHVLNSR
jgi:butyrate kinase